MREFLLPFVLLFGWCFVLGVFLNARSDLRIEAEERLWKEELREQEYLEECAEVMRRQYWLERTVEDDGS